MNGALLDSLHARISRGEFGYVDRLFITRNGNAVANHEYTHNYREISRGRSAAIGCGLDACAAWNQPADFNYFDSSRHPFYMGRNVHSLQSVTKSVASTMIGIAIRRREIKNVQEPLLSFFDDYNLSRVDPRLRNATLAHLLTMRSGIEWHEQDRPLDLTNTTLQLEFSSDWVQFTLDQPMDSDPGTKWAYNSGGSHLMSAIIRKATNTTIDKYAEQQLFGPLGITDYYWKRDPKGLPDTEGGLYLEAEQLAKIGHLYMHDGVWDGRRILPEGWVREATSRIVEGTNGTTNGYGYQWWRLDRRGVDIWAGQGFGGQYLIVIPSLGIVAVSNAWNIWGNRVSGLLPVLLNTLIDAAG
jgi:CubicO group peptidase (beta-lactamase class C family)